MKRRNFT